MDRSERSRAEILLPCHPRIAEMYMRVDESRKQHLAGSKLHPPLSSGDVSSDGDYPSVLRYADLRISQLAVYEHPAFDHRLYIIHGTPPPFRQDTAPSIWFRKRKTIRHADPSTHGAEAPPSARDAPGTSLHPIRSRQAPGEAAPP